MPNRIPTPGISTPTVRKSPAAQEAKKPVDNSESIFQKRIGTGKVKEINKTRQSVAKKTGSWPNGSTN